MIVDNADDEISVESQKDGQSISLASLLPQSDHGAIVVTSRNADVARSLVGRQQDIIMVGAMCEGEAVQLLQNKLGDGSRDGATQLVEALDYIPLAIVQAAAYMNRLGSRMPVAKYLGELKGVGKKVQLLQKAASDTRRDESALNSVLATWQISFEYIYQKRPSAVNLLSFMSFFNQQGIPEFMIRHYTDRDSEGHDDSSDIPLEEEDFEEDLAVLLAFSLVGTAKREDEFEMHGLVQLATRIWLKSTNTDRKWLWIVIQAMAQELPNGEYANWPRCQALFPHVLPIVEQEGLTVGNIEQIDKWALLLNNAGWYAWRQGLLAKAEDMVFKALEIRREVLDAEDYKILLSSNILGSIWTDLGQYKEAELISRQTLATAEKVLGFEHPATLTARTNLTLVIGHQGNHEKAESMHRQALASMEKVLGVEDPYTLSARNNLAALLERQERYEEAELIYRQTQATREKVLGVEHPDTLRTMNNLASVLRSQGKYEEAGLMLRQTVATTEKVLGVEHPETLTAGNDLALVIGHQGKYEEAESMHRHILATMKKVFGDEHPYTLKSMYNLAFVLWRQGKNKEAESMHRQTLAMSEKVLSDKHVDTLTTKNNLAEVLCSQGKHEEAELMHRQTLATREKVLGVEHLVTLLTRNNLAVMLGCQGKYKEAESMHRQTLATREKLLGVEHPETLATMYNLAFVLGHQRKHEEAELIRRKTQATLKKVLDIKHPDTLGTMNSLARVPAAKPN
jgi:tetratricopeptide (TPR) repeat protein